GFSFAICAARFSAPRPAAVRPAELTPNETVATKRPGEAGVPVGVGLCFFAVAFGGASCGAAARVGLVAPDDPYRLTPGLGRTTEHSQECSPARTGRSPRQPDSGFAAVDRCRHLHC